MIVCFCLNSSLFFLRDSIRFLSESCFFLSFSVRGDPCASCLMSVLRFWLLAAHWLFGFSYEFEYGLLKLDSLDKLLTSCFLLRGFSLSPNFKTGISLGNSSGASFWKYDHISRHEAESLDERFKILILWWYLLWMFLLLLLPFSLKPL